MIQTAEYYRRLVTSEYRYSPRFTATVKKLVSYGLDLDSSADLLIKAFEVDTAATAQLDILGRIVGVERHLNFEPSSQAIGEVVGPNPEELKSGAEFPIINTPPPDRLNGVPYLSGMPPEDMSDGNLLTDDIFRLMIKARIIQNAWKGTQKELYALWDALFPENKKIQIHDLQDMSYNIVMQGDYSDLERELILHGYIIPKPEGVRINILTFVDMSGLPLFSYDYHNTTYSGYESFWAKGE